MSNTPPTPTPIPNSGQQWVARALAWFTIATCLAVAFVALRSIFPHARSDGPDIRYTGTWPAYQVPHNPEMMSALSGILAEMPPAWYADRAFLLLLAVFVVYVLFFVTSRPSLRKRWLLPAAALGLAAALWIPTAGNRKIDAPLAAKQLVTSVTCPSQWVAVFSTNNEWIEVRWVEQLFYPSNRAQWRTISAIKIPPHTLSLCHSTMVHHLEAPLSPVHCFREGDTNIPPFSAPSGWFASSRPKPGARIAPQPAPQQPDPPGLRRWGP